MSEGLVRGMQKTCIHVFQIISLEFATGSIANPTLSRQSHKPIIHSHSIVVGE
jgi:hypothetical protein